VASFSGFSDIFDKARAYLSGAPHCSRSVGRLLSLLKDIRLVVNVIKLITAVITSLAAYFPMIYTEVTPKAR
jgi:hypothetical protein